MKRKYTPLVLILVIIFILAVFVIFNQFDAPPPSSISKTDLLPAGLDKGNGFYILWALCEPADVDIGAEPVIRKYREQDFDYDSYKKMYKQWGRKIARTRVTSPRIRDFWGHVKKYRMALLEQRGNLASLLDRYRRLILSPRIEDFTPIQRFIRHPNYHAMYNIAKLYTAVKFLEAREGKWQVALDTCLQQLDFCRRLIQSARTLDGNNMAKQLYRFVLRALVSLAYAPGSPSWLAGQASQHFGRLPLRHYGSRNALSCEYLFFETWVKSYRGHFRTHTNNDIPQFMLWFYQENRTKGYYADYLVKVMKQEEIPPYQWVEPIPPLDLKKKKLWWVQNMSGKLLFGILFFPDFSRHVNNSYVTLALHRLTRMALQFRARNDANALSEQIRSLKSYAQIDPFSGKSFRWKERDDTVIFYSVGANMKDDGGIDTVHQPGLDIAVVLKIK